MGRGVPRPKDTTVQRTDIYFISTILPVKL